ncbi:DUF7322 domain-containing protein [Halohasta salina]|uniref:DUF7322 domain-containing protein n=1 Tax=Halohasta salina TaxID=2961621 RepID=UPI0020A4834E|nr:hypothetical protein [Halohasta salina]
MSGDTTDDDTEPPGPWADPEAPFGDPEESGLFSEFSEPTDDEIDPDALAADLGDVDSELLNTFTVCVLLADVGLLLVSAGALLIVARGWLRIGGGLVVIGSLALVRLAQHYRSYSRSRSTTGDDAEPTDEVVAETGHNR